MAKDSTFYFSHDYNARNDIKIKRLISKHGYLGYGLFWAIIEELYNNANALPLDYDVLAFDLRCDYDVIKSVIEDFELFFVNGCYFGSYSVERRLNERNTKSENARKSALYRWKKSNNDANALQTESDSNAIKENKGKENKGKENKGKENKENTFLLKKETKDNLGEISNFEEIEVLETEEIKKEKSSAKKEKIIEVEIYPTFDDFWEEYDKKVGDKDKIKLKWNKLSQETKEKIMEYIPNYKASQPDKKFRKNPDTFLNNKSWNDELIMPTNYGKSTQQPIRSQSEVFIDTANSKSARNFKFS